MSFHVRAVTHGPKHHMFGFHDLLETNAEGGLLLALEINDISRPPLPGESCQAGVVTLSDGAFHAIHLTHTWNYPQGARQQWLGDSDLCVCNDRAPDGHLIARVSDARAMKVVRDLPFPVHVLTRDGTRAVYVNYDRLHAVGGYGYVPGTVVQNRRIVDLPDDDGLWVGNLETDETMLIASLVQIAQCGEVRIPRTGYPHYVTHPMLNPSGTRIAMLHQYRVPDGGDISRMMTCDLDGGNMRCLAKGLVSHYTWIDDETIFAWGGDERVACHLREAPYLRLPGVLSLAKLGKQLIRWHRGRGIQEAVAGTNKRRSRAFMLLRDGGDMPIRKSGVGVLTEDGHPMARPGDERLVICDTYPNAEGDRQLYFYDTRTETRTAIGSFRRLFLEPDLTTFDWRATQAGTDPRIIRAFDRAHYMFARSGLHCDLHPRWSHDGKTVYFDSIHEGTRQLYAVDYSC